MPESAPRPGTGRVLDGLTFIVAFVAAIVAVTMVVAVIGDRAAPADRPSLRTTGTSGPTAVPSGSTTLAPASPSPTVTPSQAPAIVATQYLSGGHTYAGLEVRTGTVVTAALDGVVVKVP